MQEEKGRFERDQIILRNEKNPVLEIKMSVIFS